MRVSWSIKAFKSQVSKVRQDIHAVNHKMDFTTGCTTTRSRVGIIKMLQKMAQLQVSQRHKKSEKKRCMQEINKRTTRQQRDNYHQFYTKPQQHPEIFPIISDWQQTLPHTGRWRPTSLACAAHQFPPIPNKYSIIWHKRQIAAYYKQTRRQLLSNFKVLLQGMWWEAALHWCQWGSHLNDLLAGPDQHRRNYPLFTTFQ